MLSCISRINEFRDLQSISPRKRSEEVHAICRQLRNLTQVIQIKDEASSNALDISRIILTAELYRKAALLYLEQAANDFSRPAVYVELLMEECFVILDQLRLCTSPWPLFILASWCMKDEHRVKILDTLEQMHLKRKIQNVRTMETIIQALWRRMDLLTTDGAWVNINWRNLIDMREGMPSFI